LLFADPAHLPTYCLRDTFAIPVKKLLLTTESDLASTAKASRRRRHSELPNTRPLAKVPASSCQRGHVRTSYEGKTNGLNAYIWRQIRDTGEG